MDAWNAARDDHPELPFIAVYQDDANAGRCFVNNAPGFSAASACMIPENIHEVKSIAARNPGESGHLVGAAFAISEGLGADEQFTVVCHAYGHVMGPDDSENNGLVHASGLERRRAQVVRRGRRRRHPQPAALFFAAVLLGPSCRRGPAMPTDTPSAWRSCRQGRTHVRGSERAASRGPPGAPR